MIDVHPTETAGDGKLVTARVKKPGDPKDERIQCAQCGFYCKPDRDTEGDSGMTDAHDSSGIQIQDVTVPFSNTRNSLPQPLKDSATFLAASRVVKDPVVSAGCPFCGTMNYRGRLRDDDVFTRGRDLSDQ